MLSEILVKPFASNNRYSSDESSYKDSGRFFNPLWFKFKVFNFVVLRFLQEVQYLDH
ncbi:hypothetical protein LCGC14_0564780 [marine sediment metagenome]|uniref:Uncharacterized protein n=1 Tax=marine sediment metagenome TaxID=412755 RepID=A0A0F9RR64_9ZZZZ